MMKNLAVMRITVCKGTNGYSVFLPPKYDFVFYETKMELIRKGKIERTVEYSDVTEVTLIKTWQNNVFINCKPIGINIYKVSDETYQRIKDIINK